MHACTVCIWCCEHASFCVVEALICHAYKYSFIYDRLIDTMLKILFNTFTAMVSFEKKVPNLKPLSFLVFFFALAHGRISIKMHSTENRIDVTGPENMLFAGVSLHHSARTFYRPGQ